MTFLDPKFELQNNHVTRFGYPITNTGATYIITDRIGLSQAYFDIEKYNLLSKGLRVSFKEEIFLLEKIKLQERKLNNELKSKGIPETILALINIKKKSGVAKYCKKIEISEYDLFFLIFNCDQINFEYEPIYHDHVPPHWDLLEEDRENIIKGDTNSVTKKINTLFLQRRHIYVHMFRHENEWHCFYFSDNDIETEKENHWKLGAHLHYINYLWTNYSYEEVWKKFDIRKTEIPGNIHIKFNPFEFPKPGEDNQNPLPLAQITTRGLLVLDIRPNF